LKKRLTCIPALRNISVPMVKIVQKLVCGKRFSIPRTTTNRNKYKKSIFKQEWFL